MCEIKTSWYGVKSRWDITEEKVNEFESIVIETPQKKTEERV
jgi:hypothetical protein